MSEGAPPIRDGKSSKDRLMKVPLATRADEKGEQRSIQVLDKDDNGDYKSRSNSEKSALEEKEDGEEGAVSPSHFSPPNPTNLSHSSDALHTSHQEEGSGSSPHLQARSLSVSIPQKRKAASVSPKDTLQKRKSDRDLRTQQGSSKEPTTSGLQQERAAAGLSSPSAAFSTPPRGNPTSPQSSKKGERAVQERFSTRWIPPTAGETGTVTNQHTSLVHKTPLPSLKNMKGASRKEARSRSPMKSSRPQLSLEPSSSLQPMQPTQPMQPPLEQPIETLSEPTTSQQRRDDGAGKRRDAFSIIRDTSTDTPSGGSSPSKPALLSPSYSVDDDPLTPTAAAPPSSVSLEDEQVSIEEGSPAGGRNGTGTSPHKSPGVAAPLPPLKHAFGLVNKDGTPMMLKYSPPLSAAPRHLQQPVQRSNGTPIQRGTWNGAGTSSQKSPGEKAQHDRLTMDANGEQRWYARGPSSQVQFTENMRTLAANASSSVALYHSPPVGGGRLPLMPTETKGSSSSLQPMQPPLEQPMDKLAEPTISQQRRDDAEKKELPESSGATSDATSMDSTVSPRIQDAPPPPLHHEAVMIYRDASTDTVSGEEFPSSSSTGDEPVPPTGALKPSADAENVQGSIKEGSARFDSLGQDELVKWIAGWRCVRKKCGRQLFGGGLVHDSKGLLDLHVMKCGHFICTECRTNFEESYFPRSYDCEECGMTHIKKDFSHLPGPSHIMLMRGALQWGGIACSTCSARSEKEVKFLYPRELMWICTEHSSLLDKLSEEELKSIDLGQYSGHVRSKTYNEEMFRMCVYCVNHRVGKHGSCKLVPIEDYKPLETTLKKENDRKPLTVDQLMMRDPWYLRALPPAAEETLMREILQCVNCNLISFSAARSENPVMLDRGRIVCSTCAVQMRPRPEAPPVVVSKNGRDAAPKPPPVLRILHDLKFATERAEGKSHIRCSDCQLVHAKDRFKITRTVNGEETIEDTRCMECFNKQFRQY